MYIRPKIARGISQWQFLLKISSTGGDCCINPLCETSSLSILSRCLPLKWVIHAQNNEVSSVPQDFAFILLAVRFTHAVLWHHINTRYIQIPPHTRFLAAKRLGVVTPLQFSFGDGISSIYHVPCMEPPLFVTVTPKVHRPPWQRPKNGRRNDGMMLLGWNNLICLLAYLPFLLACLRVYCIYAIIYLLCIYRYLFIFVFGWNRMDEYGNRSL